MLRNTKVLHKSSEIFSVILPIFKSTMNLAHIKCLSMLLGALCTVQTVCLSKLAASFDNRASSESSFRRIQRFLAQMALDLDAVVGYLKSRIPFDGPYIHSHDRPYSRRTPLPLAVTFPLSGRFRDLHPLEYVRAGRTKKAEPPDSAYQTIISVPNSKPRLTPAHSHPPHTSHP